MIVNINLLININGASYRATLLSSTINNNVSPNYIHNYIYIYTHFFFANRSPCFPASVSNGKQVRKWHFHHYVQTTNADKKFYTNKTNELVNDIVVENFPLSKVCVANTFDPRYCDVTNFDTLLSLQKFSFLLSLFFMIQSISWPNKLNSTFLGHFILFFLAFLKSCIQFIWLVWIWLEVFLVGFLVHETLDLLGILQFQFEQPTFLVTRAIHQSGLFR